MKRDLVREIPQVFVSLWHSHLNENYSFSPSAFVLSC